MEVMEDIAMLKGLAPEEENVLNKFGKVELTESELASIQHLGSRLSVASHFWPWRWCSAGKSSTRHTKRQAAASTRLCDSRTSSFSDLSAALPNLFSLAGVHS